MQKGMLLPQFAAELMRQKEAKADFVSDTRELSLDSSLQLKVGSIGSFSVGNLAHNQIAERLKMPVKFYDHLRSNHPDMLAFNVNELFKREPERRMVRTMDGKARAFLSDRYRIMDNAVVAETVLPLLGSLDDVEVLSAEITESRLYLQVVNKRISAEVKKGDVVQSGVIISNSEVGLGAFNVTPLVYRLVCLNGAIVNALGSSSYHIGKRAAAQDGAYELYRDETLLADDRAFMLKAGDLVRAAIADVRGFETIVGKWREATERSIESNPVKSVEVVAKRFQLSETERGSVLTHLIQGGDLSAYGVMNAITRSAQDSKDYDRAVELQAIGPKVIDLPTSEWKQIALAA